MYCNNCELTMTFVATIEKNDQFYHFYTCMKCNESAHDITYKYTHSTCPRHQFEHLGTEFKDSHLKHTIYQVDRCDRCGCLRRIPRHTIEAGFTGRVDLNDPRVNFLWNKSAAGIIFDKAEVNELKPPDHAEIPAEKDV